MKKNQINDRVRGGLYGVAVGDALGATVEFMNPKAIQKTYGQLKDIVGGGWLNLAPGEWTDDTEMTLAVARGIIADPDNPVPHIGQGFIRWRKTNPPDIGSTIRTVFRIWNRDSLTHEQWHVAAEQAHQEMRGMGAGNGALMRTLPVGIAYKTISSVFDQSIDIARVTHWDIRAGLTCAIYSMAVNIILSGKVNKPQAITEAVYLIQRMAASYGNCKEEIAEITNILIKKDVSNLKPTGYTVDSFQCALWAFLTKDTLEEAIVAAVNLGGDADTIGAITGGLAGVYWGYKAIPKRWINKFSPEQCATLDEISEGLIRLARRKS